MDFTGIGQAVSSVSDFAGNILDRFWPKSMDPADKAKAQIELQHLISARDNSLIDAQKSIIVAELQQSDNYTKRARPTIIYAGLGFIFLVHVAAPIAAAFTSINFPNLVLPEAFWWSWGGICSVYAVGRSAEKKGVQNNLINMITGGK